MHVFIVGGTGATGRLIIADALSQGHSVTALVRNTAAVVAQPNLTVVEGTPLEPKDVARGLRAGPRAPDAVVVSLRLATTSSSPLAPLAPGASPHLIADSVANLMAGMKEMGGVRKLVVLSAQGTGSSFSGVSHLHKALFRWSNMKLQYADHDAADAAVRAAAARGDVDFVLVRPVMMADGDAAAVHDHGDAGKGAGFMPKITRASVARFMVTACETDQYDGRSPVISN